MHPPKISLTPQTDHINPIKADLTIRIAYKLDNSSIWPIRDEYRVTNKTSI